MRSRARSSAILTLAGSLTWVWVLGCGSSQPSSDTAAQPDAAPPGPVFLEEISERVGLSYKHDSGAQGQCFMPEQVGPGAAFLDYDKDGRLDIYLIHCGGPDSSSRNQLYHQEPDGSFRDVSPGSGLDLAGYGMGVAVGDVNNDGWVDVFLTEYGAIRLLLNRQGQRFEETSVQAGLENARWATASSMVDYDRDGWLDIVVGNYVDYSPTHKCYDATGAPEYCDPDNFRGSVTRLHRNLGPAGDDQTPFPRFEDVTVPSGLAKALGPALGIFCGDFDGDHWPDIFVADDGKPNRLFLNQRDGTFIEEATLRGLAYNGLGMTAGNMGVAVGDVDRNGLFDVFVTHLAEEQHALWEQGPRGVFEDHTALRGLVNPKWRGTGFGTVLADLDLDGWLDLAVVNGLVKRGRDPAPRHPRLDPFWSPYAQRYQLFHGLGQGRFADVSEANNAFCGQAAVGRGLACADYDNDGDLDLLAVSAGGPAQLYRNVAERRGRWLALRVVDPALGGRDAYGAEIIVRAGPTHWWRLAQPSSSYLSSNDPRVHLGLGPLDQIDRVDILWPDGSEETFPGPAVDTFVTLEKGSGRIP